MTMQRTRGGRSPCARRDRATRLTPRDVSATKEGPRRPTCSSGPACPGSRPRPARRSLRRRLRAVRPRTRARPLACRRSTRSSRCRRASTASASRARSATSRSGRSRSAATRSSTPTSRAFVAATGRAVRPPLRARADAAARRPPGDRASRSPRPLAFCAWAPAGAGACRPATSGRPRPAAPTGAPWPWGDTFDPDALRLRRGRLGLDRARSRAHPDGAAPVRRRAAGRQRVGVGRRPARRGRLARGARRLATSTTRWGVRACARRCPPTPRAPRPPPASASPIDHHDQEDDRERRPRPRPRRGRSTRCATSTTPAAPTAASASSTWASSRTSASTARHVDVDLVLTTGWCPFVASMSTAIPDAPARLDGVETVDVAGRVGPRLDAGPAVRRRPATKLAMPLEELEPYRERRLAAARGA